MISITYSIRALPFIFSPQSTVRSPVFWADSFKRPGYQLIMAVEVVEAVGRVAGFLQFSLTFGRVVENFVM